MLLPPLAIDTCIRSLIKLKELNDSEAAALTDSFSSAMRRVYRGVALDVDGTLVDHDDDGVSAELGQQISQLLYKGIPIVLISGRGRTSLRRTCERLRTDTGLSYWYLRRLHVIGYNGEFMLYTRTGSPDRFLGEELYLQPESIDKHALQQLLKQGLANVEYEAQEKDRHVRILVAPNDLDTVLRLVGSNQEQFGNIFVSQYRQRVVVDCTRSTKGSALEKFAEYVGVPRETILRIGDNGQEGGNDAEMLKSSSGFSVEHYSKFPEGCFAVIDPANGEQLVGSSATFHLLNSVRIFPPLSLQAGNLRRRREAITGFEKLAAQRYKDEERIVTEQLRAKYRTLVPTGERFISSGNLMISDFFDPLSGAVRLREWEMVEAASNHPQLAKAFGIEIQDGAPVANPEYVLHSDSAYLLRGTLYYYSLANESPSRRSLSELPNYCHQQLTFLKRCTSFNVANDSFSITLCGHKLILGLIDNLRNTAINYLYALFLVWENGGGDFKDLRLKTHTAALSSVNCFRRALFDSDFDRRRCLQEIQKIITELIEVSEGLMAFSPGCPTELELFKFRECDYFLQNIVAVQIAMRDFVRHGLFEHDTCAAVGIAYGGIELPLLVKCVGDQLGLSVDPYLVRISLYGKKVSREPIYNANQEYLEELSKNIKCMNICGAADEFPTASVVLGDDNCTTCLTLQAARDAFVYRNLSVKGAIVVRYPSTNRIAQMAMDNHGFPEPENLLGFVRGLVAPSPYSRLRSPANEGNPYVDERGIFDKSKHRIKDLIVKSKGT